MANAMFYPAKRSLLAGEINIQTGVFKAVMLKNYTYNSSHKFKTDIPVTMYSPTILTLSVHVSNAWVLCAPFSFSSSPNDPLSNYHVLVYQASGPSGGADLPDSQQRLCTFHDTGAAELFPINPLGGRVDFLFSTALWIIS